MAELVVLNGARAGAVFELPDMPTVVGRSPEAHFQLDDPWISSMHALFERRGPDIWVVDLESRNGTFVGPERIQEALVVPGAVLRFGRTEVRMEKQGARQRGSASHRPTPPPSLGWPTSRLDAPATTGPHVPLRSLPVPEPANPLPLAPRPVALVRLALHMPCAAPPDAELVRTALDALLRAGLNEGGLATRVGGGVLAIFGASAPSPDDVEVALRAAEAACLEVPALGAGLAVRAAVDAGPVLLGNLGGRDAFELAALGEVAERTERVLALAGPGEILVGPGAISAGRVERVFAARVGAEEMEIGRAR